MGLEILRAPAKGARLLHGIECLGIRRVAGDLHRVAAFEVYDFMAGIPRGEGAVLVGAQLERCRAVRRGADRCDDAMGYCIGALVGRSNRSRRSAAGHRRFGSVLSD